MVTLRPYQQQAVSALKRFMAASYGSGLVVCPPAAGKTTIAMAFISQHLEDYAFIWLAHNVTLLQQAAKTAERFGITNWWGWSSSWREGSEDPADILFLSVFTRKLDEPFSKLKKAEKLCLIIDEAHHEAADSYAEVAEEIRRKLGKIHKKIGLTATPFRLDRKELNFSMVIFEASWRELTKQGYLTPARYFRVETKLKAGLERVGADYSRRTLKMLHKKDRALIVARTYKKRKHGRTLVYLPDIEACHLQVKAFKEEHPDVRVVAITERTPLTEREAYIKDMREGNLDVICNVAVFSEGVDIPEIDSVFLARPTLSKTLFVQMIGRGARTAAGKNFFNIVDFVDLDVPHYEYMTAIWREEYLDHKVPAKVDRKRRLEKIEEKIKKAGFKKSRLRWIYTEEELLSLYGMMKVGQTVYAITSLNYKDILSAVQLISSKPAWETVQESFSLFGYHHTDFYRWMKIAWKIYFKEIELIELRKFPVFDYQTYYNESRAVAEMLEAELKQLIRDGIMYRHDIYPLVRRVCTTEPINYKVDLRVVRLMCRSESDSHWACGRLISNKLSQELGTRVALIFDMKHTGGGFLRGGSDGTI